MTARGVLPLVYAGVLALVTARGGASHASDSQPAKSSVRQTSSAQTSQPAANCGGGSGSGGRGGIPQNNGGDHDGDNNGGPSDGDGNT
jgi:hypothetical protein